MRRKHLSLASKNQSVISHTTIVHVLCIISHTSIVHVFYYIQRWRSFILIIILLLSSTTSARQWGKLLYSRSTLKSVGPVHTQDWFRELDYQQMCLPQRNATVQPILSAVTKCKSRDDGISTAGSWLCSLTLRHRWTDALPLLHTHTGAVPDYEIREIYPDAIVWTRVVKKKKKKKDDTAATDSSNDQAKKAEDEEEAEEEEKPKHENGYADEDDEEELLEALEKGPGQFMLFLLVVKEDTFSNELEAMTTGR